MSAMNVTHLQKLYTGGIEGYVHIQFSETLQGSTEGMLLWTLL